MAIKKSSGDVFKDLGFATSEAANLRVRAFLMSKLTEWIKDNEFKQKDAAEILGVTQSRVSDIMTGKIQKFTVDNLLNMLSTAGFDFVPVETKAKTSLIMKVRAA